jgi:hypothetical protein
MLLWRPISAHLGLPEINYPMAMLVTITLWIAVAPLAAAAAKRKKKNHQVSEE